MSNRKTIFRPLESNHRKSRKCFFCVLLALLLVCQTLLAVPTEAFAATLTDDSVIPVSYTVKYLQTDSRSELELINEFRTGEDAWYWNDDNTTKTTCSGLSTLQWDYDLEKVAMQRAAETALSWDHTRTDGTTCWTAYTEAGYSCSAKGENIACGRGACTTAAAAYTLWREDNYGYSGQGHRRNMLSGDYNRVAVAGVYYQGAYYWVQEFAYSTSSNSTTTANDSETTVTANVRYGDLTTNTISSDSDSISIASIGGTAQLPTATARIQMAESACWNTSNGYPVTVDLTYAIADTTIAGISGSTITGLKAGETTLIITSALGATLNIPVTVAQTAHTHTYDSGVVTKEATCSATGVRTYTCTTCGYSYTETIAKTEHTYGESTIATAPTCTVHGWKQHVCQVCGSIEKYYTSSDPDLAALGHDYQVTSTDFDNCETGGTVTYTCSRCSATTTSTIAAGSHTWDNGSVEKSSTCTTAGVKKYTCSVCGQTKTEEIPSTGHSYVSTTKAATCEETGYTRMTCSSCGDSYDSAITPALGHNWQLTATNITDCQTGGSASYRCSTCGQTKEEAIAAGDHVWGEASVEKEASCTAAGQKKYTCTICGQTKTEEIPATGHSYLTTITQPTCTSKGYTTYTCTICGDSYTGNETAMTSHTAAAAVEENRVEASYTSAGSYDSVVYCSVCGTELSRTKVTIPKLTTSDISGASVKIVGTDDFSYDGNAIEPEISVSCGGTVLTEGTDYSVRYENNILPGKASIIVSGMGAYSGSKTIAFSIAKYQPTLYLDEDYVELNVGDYYDIGIYNEEGYWVDPSDLSVTCSDDSVVSVDSDLEITGLEAGECTLTFTLPATDVANEASVSMTVAVIDEDSYPMVELTLNQTCELDSDNAIYYFEPTETAYYRVKSSGSKDPALEIYAIDPESGEYISDDWIFFADDMPDTDSLQFDYNVLMEAGKRYEFVGWNYNDDNNCFTLTITKAAPKLTAIANTTGGVKLTWQEISGSDWTEADDTWYRVFRKTSSTGWTRVKDVQGTSYTDSTAASGTNYIYTVRALNDSKSAYISSFDASGKTIRYLTALTPTLTNTSTGITVKWSKVTGATGYYVYRKTGSGSYSRIKTITSASTVSYTDTAVKSNNGTAYTYAVRAYYTSGSTTYTGSYTGKSTYRLTTPSISSLTAGSKKITVKWAKNSTASGYQIQYSTSSSFTTSTTKTVTVSGASTVSRAITGLTKGKKYYIRIRTYKTNSAGTSYYSGWSSTKYTKAK